MPNYLLKLKDKYFEWSSVVDAPISYGMDQVELRQYISEKYGSEGLRALPARLSRVDAWGTSRLGFTNVQDLIAYNRAGDGETHLSADEIYEKYSTTPTTHPSGAMPPANAL